MIGPRSAAVAAITLVAVVTGGGCTDSQKAFCNDLKADYRLTSLRNAIDRADRAGIEHALTDLEDLADEAPKAIAIDLHEVVDTVVSTVRAVTNVTGPGGERMPVDLATLNAALAKVSGSSQRVVSYADRDCGLQLDR